MKTSIVLAEYNPQWRIAFERISAELNPIFQGPGSVTIEHIGSTAVPGLCAKPVIDILVGAESLHVFSANIDELAALGYRYRPEHEHSIPQRRYFTRDAGSQFRVHLHGVVMGNQLWHDHLAFRNALRENQQLAAEYATLKRTLAHEFAHDKAAYTNAKAPFIQRVLNAG